MDAGGGFPVLSTAVIALLPAELPSPCISECPSFVIFLVLENSISEQA